MLFMIKESILLQLLIKHSCVVFSSHFASQLRIGEIAVLVDLKLAIVVFFHLLYCFAKL